MGRHATTSAGKRSTRWRWIVGSATVLAVATAATLLSPSSHRSGGAASQTRKSSGQTCTQSVHLNVLTASGIAPVVRAAGAPACTTVTVTVNDTGTGASAVATGQADVWVPDSRARALLAGSALAGKAVSTAVSPIVMVAGPAAATATPGNKSSWGVLLKRPALAPVTVAMQDPATSSVGLVVAAGVKDLAVAATGDKYVGLAATAAALTDLPVASVTKPSPQQLRIVESRLVDKADVAREVTMSEGNPQLDYPWVTAPGLDPSTAAAAAQLLKTVLGPTGSTARKAAGLLDPGATSIKTKNGISPLIAVPALDAIPALYALSNSSGLHGNGLALLDISGSMNDPASPGGPSKMTVLKSSAAVALGFLSTDTSLGLWQFGYQLTPGSDYQELVPLAPMDDAQRTRISAALNAVTPRVTGTGLYDTVLAAYQSVQAHWLPARNNQVVVFSDGKDEDAPGGLSLDQLTAKIHAIADPARPVHVLCFGYGAADIAAMQAIVTAAGGYVYAISTPDQIIGAFIDAIAQSSFASSK